MRETGLAPRSGGRLGWSTSPWVGVAVALIFSAMSWVFLKSIGTLGLVLLGGGALAAVGVAIIAFRTPVAVAVFWFLIMSGFQTMLMVRMPGMPDFSLPRLFTIIIMLIIMVAWILGRSPLRAPHLPSFLLVVYTMYVFWNLFAIGVPERFHTWLNSCFAPMLAFFFAMQFVESGKQMRLFLVSFMLVTVYFWITSFGEHFEYASIVWPHSILDRRIGNPWFGRSRGPFFQPALFGQLLGMYLLVHLYYLTRRVGLTWKALILANLGLGSIGLLYTYTRGGWLATAVGVAVLAILRPAFRKVTVALALVAVLAASLGLLAPKDDEFLAERLENRSTVDNRLGFLAASIRMIEDYPLFGVGYFRFTELRYKYNQGTEIPFYGFVRREAGAEVSIHDIYIGRAAEEGLVGLVLFLSFWVVMVGQWWRRWREGDVDDWFNRDSLAMIAAVTIAYLVGGMIIDFRYFDIINVIPYFFAGIVIGYPRRAVRGVGDPGAGFVG